MGPRNVLGIGDRYGDEERDEWRGDPVVQAAFDVQLPAHPVRDPGILEHGEAEGQVGRSQDRGGESPEAHRHGG